jgi:hypothetical protein
MKMQRMTKEEYLQTKAEIDDIKQKIALLRERKKKLTNKVRWYEYTEKDVRKDYTDSIAFQMFGKRLKDLTEREKREYTKECTRRSREQKINKKERA